MDFPRRWMVLVSTQLGKASHAKAQRGKVSPRILLANSPSLRLCERGFLTCAETNAWMERGQGVGGMSRSSIIPLARATTCPQVVPDEAHDLRTSRGTTTSTAVRSPSSGRGGHLLPAGEKEKTITTRHPSGWVAIMAKNGSPRGLGRSYGSTEIVAVFRITIPNRM